MDRATVRWPSGTVQELTNVGVNQTLVIVEPLPTAVSDGDTPRTPLVFRLSQNHPNPFNAATSIEFLTPKAGPVSLVIYDLKGSPLKRLVAGRRDAGRHVVLWDASGVASGVYIYKLDAGRFTQTRKMALLKLGTRAQAPGRRAPACPNTSAQMLSGQAEAADVVLVDFYVQL